METCDVVIVGGGPAGSSCAWKLCSQGFNVLVLDRATFPRDKTCAGWITPPVIQELEIDIEAYRQERTFQPITGFRVGMIGGREVMTRFEEPVSFGIRRCEFDHFLLKRSGARCRLGEPIRTIERAAGRWIIDGEISTPLLVGAGGHFCPVARMLRNHQPPRTSVVVAQEIEFAVSAQQLGANPTDPAVPELYFCGDLLGYGWCFRKGEFVNVGLGRTDGRRLSEHVQQFWQFLCHRGRFRGPVPGRLSGHAYQLHEGTPQRPYGDGVLLIGDAAGLAHPKSGEGIRPAVESGLLAARVIQKSAPNYSSECLSHYGPELHNRFGKPVSQSWEGWLPNGMLQFVAARLLETQWFSRNVVLNRWFLQTHQRPLCEGVNQESCSRSSASARQFGET